MFEWFQSALDKVWIGLLAAPWWAVREFATARLARRPLSAVRRFRASAAGAADLEVKWRLGAAIRSIYRRELTPAFAAFLGAFAVAFGLVPGIGQQVAIRRREYEAIFEDLLWDLSISPDRSQFTANMASARGKVMLLDAPHPNRAAAITGANALEDQVREKVEEGR